MEAVSVDIGLLANARIRPLSCSEYEALAETGAFEDEKIELLAGMLVEMSPQGNMHLLLVVRLANHLGPRVPSGFEFIAQVPYALSPRSMPEPDGAIVPRLKRGERPRAARLVIEISSSSLDKDLTIKGPLYAAGGVPEYWVIDADDLTTTVHRDPVGTAYTRVAAYASDATVTCEGMPMISMCVDDLVRD